MLYIYGTPFFLLTQQNPLYCPERCCAFQCDLTKDHLTENVPEGSVDVVTLIFVLSAIHPDKMKLAVENIGKVTEIPEKKTKKIAVGYPDHF